MKKLYVCLFLALALSACGKGEPGAPGAPGADAPPAAPAPLPPAPTDDELEQATIDDLIYQENLFRYNNLSAQLTKGMLCRVYKYVNTGSIAIAGVGLAGLGTTTLKLSYPYVGSFNHDAASQSDGLNFIPDPYRAQALYQSEVYVDCQGSIVITETKFHNFTAFSDDNLILTVNSVVLVNDDTSHGVSAIASGASLSLKQGNVVTFRVQYRQYNGASVLKLYQNGELLEPKYLYH